MSGRAAAIRVVPRLIEIVPEVSDFWGFFEDVARRFPEPDNIK